MKTAGASRKIVWLKRLVPMGVGAGLLYLVWRLVTANEMAVEVDFLFGRMDLALWQALGTSFLLGAALVGLYALFQMARGGLVSRRYRKQLADLEIEVHQLRNLPLSPDGAWNGALEGARELHEREPGGAAGSSS